MAPFLADGRLNEENAVFARHLASGVLKDKDKIDQYIKKFATAWPLEQIPVVDRNILRLAIFEVLLDNSVPIKVAINEAVELAKLFGSDNSPKFVNGVLGSVSRLASR
ncbi:Transcription antitermination protein NusB [subsurface metagenome]